MNGNTLGALGVDLYANTATFEADMGRAARIAERDLQSMQRMAVRAGAAIGAGITVAVGAFVYMTQQAIAARSALDDMADITGDSVESLDGLRRQAHIAGVEMERLQNIITRTARGIDSRQGQSAIAAIGLDVERLRALKPGEAMQEIAEALAKYEDGQGKINVASAIWGSREGPRMLALMKDLAEAGRQNGVITTEQAAAAEKAEKEWRRLRLAFSDAKEGLMSEIIPAVVRLIEQMNEGIRIAGGLGAALKLAMSQPVGDVFRTPAENIKATQKLLDDLRAGRENMSQLRGYDAAIADVDKEIALAEKRLAFYKFQQRQAALELAGPGSLDARDLAAARRAGLDFSTLPDAPSGRGRATRDNTAAEYARSLQSQQDILDEAARLGVRFQQAQEAMRIKASAEQGKQALQAWVESARVAMEAAESMVYTWDAAGNRIEMTREAFEALERQTRQTDNVARDLGLTFSSAFEDAILQAKSLQEVLRAVLQDIARIVVRKSLTEPLAGSISEAVSGKDGGGFLGFLKDLVPKFDAGTPYVPRDMLAFVHRGEAIIPAGQNGGMNVYIDARGAGPAESAAIMTMLRSLDASIEPRAVAANLEAAARGIRG